MSNMTAQEASPAKKTRKAKKEKKPKTPRVAYIDSDVAASIRNEDGKLTAAPVDFDSKLHKAPRKNDFADDVIYMRWAANIVEAKAEAMAQRAINMRETADVIEKYGDPAQRAKIKRAQKLKDQLAELEAALKADGVDL